MVGNGKTRITITVGDKVLDNLDAYCDQTGLTRSAAISAMVAEQLATKNQLMGVLSQTFGPENMAALLKRAD